MPLPRGSPLAEEHNPCCSHLHRNTIVHPMSSRGPRCVSRYMREIPSEMEFHGLLGGLGNSDRNAHLAEGPQRVCADKTCQGWTLQKTNRSEAKQHQNGFFRVHTNQGQPLPGNDLLTPRQQAITFRLSPSRPPLCAFRSLFAPPHRVRDCVGAANR